jgi:hypothetical protein
MYDRGKVNNLGHQPNDFWTEQRKAAHAKKIVDGGGSKRGRMEERSTKKKEHVAKCEAKNGCKLGPMVGTARDEHFVKSVAKGGYPKGPMIGTKLVDHHAKQAEGLKKASTLLFRLANGKKDQVHVWTESCRKNGNATIYTFTNGFDDPIEGKRDFEDYLVDSYESEDLTEDGKLALVEMKKKRDASDKRKARYDRKKKRAK